MKILLGYTPTDIDFMRILHLFEKEFAHVLPSVVGAFNRCQSRHETLLLIQEEFDKNIPVV